MSNALLDNSLQNAVKAGNFDHVKLLLKNGADIKCTSSMGWTLLQTLIFHCKTENRGDIAQFLIDQGCSVSALNTYRGSALGLAIFRKDPVYIDVLVKAGVSLDKLNNDYDSYGKNDRWPMETPLSYAVRHNDVKLVDRLLDCGADPAIPDAKGNTPFILAISGGNMEIVNMLERATA